MIQPLSVVCYEHSLKHNVTPREIRCCIKKDQIKRRRKIKILLVVTIMHFFASLVMDKTNETLGRTGGGDE